MRLYRTPQTMLAEVSRMRKAEQYRCEDRKTVSEFFGGKPPISQTEADELGLNFNVNHLFGYSDLLEADDQMFSLYTKPSRLFEVDLDWAPAHKRTEWRAKVTSEFQRVLKKNGRLKLAYKGVTGDSTMHGEGVFFYPNTTHFAPKQCPLSKLLVPDETPADARELTHFAIDGAELTLEELHSFHRHAPPGWSAGNLRKLLKEIYEDQLKDTAHIDPENIEEAEYRRQENSSAQSARRPMVKVIYFYQRRCDKNGSPFDLTILRKGESYVGDSTKAGEALLFDEECAYPTVHDIIHPFFMDCIIGGTPTWHRVLGLGHLNYQLNYAVELLINRASQATWEGSMNLWQAKDSVTREEVERVLMRHNGVIPENFNLVQNRFAPNFGGILEMIQFFRQQGSKNARGTTPNNGSKNDQLEIQALFEQNTAASTAASRTSNWYDYLDALGGKMLERLANPFICPCDPGYSEAMDFQGALERAGIPLYAVQPHNVQVTSTRMVGNGYRAKEISAAQFLMQNRQAYAPEVQPRITRLVTGLMLDDHQLAEELTPMTETADDPQHLRAQMENSIMLTERKPLAATAEDIDELHLINHFPALARLVQDGIQYQRGSFVPQQAEAFQIIGAHCVVHIQRLEGRAQNRANDADRMRAKAFMDQLNQLAAMGQKLMHNMQQTQQGEEIPPAELARLQLDAEKLALQREKLSHSVQKFERQQQTREQQVAFDQMMRMEIDRRDDRTTRQEMAARDIELATKVSGNGSK